MEYAVVSVLKPELVSKGLSICRVKSGEIVISAHRDKQHILFELSNQEFFDFSEKINALCQQLSETPNVVTDTCLHSGSDAQAGMYAAEIVVGEVQRDSGA